MSGGVDSGFDWGFVRPAPGRAATTRATPPKRHGWDTCASRWDAAANDIQGRLADLRRDLVQARDQLARAGGDAPAVGQVVAATGNLIQFGNRLQVAAALTDDARLDAGFVQAPQCRDLRAVDLSS